MKALESLQTFEGVVGRPRPGCLFPPSGRCRRWRGWGGGAACARVCVHVCARLYSCACECTCMRCVHVLVNAYAYMGVCVSLCIFECICMSVFMSQAAVTDKNRIGAFSECETVISQGPPSFVQTNPRQSWSRSPKEC